MMLGAYGFAISIKEGLPMPVGILMGFLAAFVFALILGVPTLKLRGDYLAIVTISAAEILRYIGRLARLEDFTGAAQGIPGSQYRDPFTNLSFFGDGTFDAGGWLPELQLTGVNGWWVRFVAWLLVALCCLLVFLLVRSPWGRLLRGIREDEDAIRSLGKNVFAIKMQALVIGGLFGALGGMIYILPASMQPDAMGRSLTFFCWTALLLGGAATVFGPVMGAVLFFALRIFIQGTSTAVVPADYMNLSQAAQFAWICVGVALMLLVIFRPQGILGDKRELRFNV
jgi:neutral amino acid transport system permease protein